MPVSDLFSTFSNNILPVMLISSAGCLLGKIVKHLSRSTGLFLIKPILAFFLLILAWLHKGEIFKTIMLAIDVILGSKSVALVVAIILVSNSINPLTLTPLFLFLGK